MCRFFSTAFFFLFPTQRFFFCCRTGIYYRPASLKSMTVLVGNTEKRQVYKNFELSNLHQNLPDFSHANYEYYLENNYFIPPPSSSSSSSSDDAAGGRRNYWAHSISNLVPSAPSTTDDKGLFNVFPLDLTSLDAKSTAASTLGKHEPPPLYHSARARRNVLTPPLLFFFAVAGVISTSPLKLELEFEPVLDNCTWYLCCTYQYMSRINFTGNKMKQDVSFDYI